MNTRAYEMNKKAYEMKMKNQIQATTQSFCRQLIEQGIPFTIEHCLDGWKWTFPDYPDGDIICHRGSYGVEHGHVESYRMPWDGDDVTHCTPSEMVVALLTGEMPQLF